LQISKHNIEVLKPMPREGEFRDVNLEVGGRKKEEIPCVP
jgi:hypothetical protein